MKQEEQEVKVRQSWYYKEGRVVLEEREKEEQQPVRIDRDEYPATVGVDRKRTRNLGDYNSVSYSVSVYLPAAINELDEAYEAAVAFVEDKIQETEKEIKEYLDSKK